MRAQHPGTCVTCSHPHIRVGDQIQRRLGGYAALGCVFREDRVRSLGARIGTAMQRREGLALGSLGHPTGCRPVATRERFYTLAVELGHCTADEYRELAEFYAMLGTWCPSLDD